MPFANGVCGAAARTKKTQLVPDVTQFPGHIDYSPDTRSEIVLPIVSSGGGTVAVLDVDSNHASAFATVDQAYLEAIGDEMAVRYADQFSF